MKIVESVHEAYALVDFWRRDGQTIGLVPTMGALHDGHLSLVKRSRGECDVSIATIFVNPTQFGPHEDFAQYPRTLEADFGQLVELGVDMVFVPSRDALYPADFSTYVQPPVVARHLEGESRPEHFRGVVTIVLKLFQILPATVAYFGQKDFQQQLVIKRMVEDLNVPIRVQTCETVREPDGLALSSRNRYLSPPERQAALGLCQALRTVQKEFESGEKDVVALEKMMVQQLRATGVEQIDYARVVCQERLSELETINRPSVALIAAHVGKTRLIDNVLLV